MKCRAILTILLSTRKGGFAVAQYATAHAPLCVGFSAPIGPPCPLPLSPFLQPASVARQLAAVAPFVCLCWPASQRPSTV